jgi:hypothetical protein
MVSISGIKEGFKKISGGDVDTTKGWTDVGAHTKAWQDAVGWDSLSGKDAARHAENTKKREAAEAQARTDARVDPIRQGYEEDRAGVTSAQQTIDPASMNAAQLAAAQQATAASFAGANINMAPQDQLRAQQMAFAQQLQQQAQGIGAPSVANLQLQAGTDRGLAQQMAMAASQGGGALAQRQSQRGMADISQAAAGQAAALRAQEQLAAQNQYAQALSGVRGQDIGLATSQAGFDQQTGLANAGFTQQANLANQAAMNQFELAQAGFDQQANVTNAGFQQQANIAQVEAQLQADAQADAMRRAFLGAETQALGIQEGAFQTQQQLQAQTDAQNKANQSQQGAAGLGALGAMGAAMLSDQSLKENIESTSDADMGSFLDALTGYNYNYKDENHGSGKKVGIMAQDLEKSEIGKLLVIETPEGKAVDTKMGFGTALAAISSLNKRIKELEEEK